MRVTKKLIEFSYDNKNHRPDVVNICSNCGEISASHFLICPRCKHKPLKKKAILFYTDNLKDIFYPSLIVSREELKNRFVPGVRVDNMTDETLIKISNKINEMVLQKMPDIFLKAAYKVLGENTIMEGSRE